MSVAIAITVFRNPGRLQHLLDNITWAGRPDIPLYVFEDPSPFDDRAATTAAYRTVCDRWQVPLRTAPAWGCMHGAIEFAFQQTTEDWIIYVPDDVIFTRGALWNEYAGVLAYGRPFIGGIQAPYWNATELVELGHMPSREAMFTTWRPDDVPHNPHWDAHGLPRKYINLNGAGFSLSRQLWRDMGGWPRSTWRLDEYAGYCGWKHGYAMVTLPGAPRIHYFGGATPLAPDGMTYHTVEAWQEATGGTPEETGLESRAWMGRIPESAPDGTINDILTYFGSAR